MTYLEAALQVLHHSRCPLTTTEITQRILRERLVRSQGRTPEATLSAALYRGLGKYPQLRRVAEPGPKRAKRGSVRWTLTQ
jgi:hypothetical protein